MNTTGPERIYFLLICLPYFNTGWSTMLMFTCAKLLNVVSVNYVMYN